MLVDDIAEEAPSVYFSSYERVQPDTDLEIDDEFELEHSWRSSLDVSMMKERFLVIENTI